MTIFQRLLTIAIMAAAALVISAPSSWAPAPTQVIADETNWGVLAFP